MKLWKKNAPKSWKKSIKQKHPKSLIIEASILQAKEIPLEVLRQPKTTNNDKIIPFTATYDLDNPNIFSIIKQSFIDFQHSKTKSDIFQKKKTLWAQHLIYKGCCRSKFESQEKVHVVKKI